MGEYKAGEKLPSKRVMAELTGYSIITVQTAYDMLSDEGYVKARQRSGYFVLPLENSAVISESERMRRVVHVEDSESTEYGDFEYSVWFKTIRKVITEDGERLFVKAPVKGCAVLRNAIADYLHRYRGMTADANRIIIGSGAEQLYEIAVKLLGRELVFGIENPCYEQIPEVYEGMGVKLCRLEMTDDGIHSDELNNGKFDILHVTPYHSYPSGISTSASKRYQYLGWAQRRGGYIIEDDFDSEFFLPGQPVQTLYSMNGEDSVIYINTFSKSLSPAIRVGYMILPESLVEKYDEKMGRFSCTVPVMEQYVLAEFINNGNFERHLNRRRRRMKEK